MAGPVSGVYVAVTLTTVATVPAFTLVEATPFSSVSVDAWDSEIPPTVVDRVNAISSPVVIGLPFLSLSWNVTSETLGLPLVELPLSAIESGATVKNSSSPISGAATLTLAVAVEPLGSRAVMVSVPAHPASYVVLKEPDVVVIGVSKTAF